MKFDSSYLWSPRYAPWIILALLALFALLILYEVASVFTFRHSLNSARTKETAPPPVIKQEKITQNLDTTLFGVYTPPEQQSTGIAPSKLKVELIGIMYSDNPADSLVIIKKSNGEEQGFKVGDTLDSNAVIDSISPNGIVVKHNGSLERINFQMDELIFEPVAKPLMED